jgi:hypothetical protein
MRAATLLTATLIVGLATPLVAQGPPIPQPGPEHEILKRDVGVWDFTIDISLGPGMPTFSMMGVETNTMFADRWLLSETQSDVMGQAFEGRSISGYDPDKKAYVYVSADTMSTSFTQGENTYDAATNTLTGWVEMNDPMAGKAKAKTVATWPDADSRVVKVFQPADSPEPFMVMTYKRRQPAEAAAPAEPAKTEAPAEPAKTEG